MPDMQLFTYLFNLFHRLALGLVIAFLGTSWDLPVEIMDIVFEERM